MAKPEEIEFAKLLFGGIAIMILLALTIVIFIVLYQRKLYIQQANLHQLELTHQKTLLESIVNSQESERERIARDLHDEVGASLSAAKLFVNQIQYETSAEEMKNLAGQSSQILGETVKDIRQIAHNLSPITLENFGLAEAIKILIKRLEASGLSTNFIINFTPEVLNSYQQLILYRIVQEVLNNVVKHAAATHLTLYLNEDNQMLSLYIEDNGKGFDDQKANEIKSFGMGIGTIKARSGLLGARFQITSATGQGTRIEITIPL